MKTGYLLPLLNRGRAAVDESYERLVKLARNGEALSCALLDSYRVARQKQLGLESQLVDFAKANTIAVPEEAPRSLGTFGACSPGTDEVRFDRTALKLAEVYLTKKRQRETQATKLLADLYEKNAGWRTHFDKLLEGLSGMARAGTDEVLPPPGNIALLRLLYFSGGTLWPVNEIEKLRLLETPPGMPGETVRAFQEAGELGSLVANLGGADDDEAGESAAPSAKVPIIVGVASTLGTIGIGALAWWLGKRDERHYEAGPAGYYAEDEPQAKMLPARRRKKKRKPRKLLTESRLPPGMEPEILQDEQEHEEM